MNIFEGVSVLQKTGRRHTPEGATQEKSRPKTANTSSRVIALSLLCLFSAHSLENLLSRKSSSAVQCSGGFGNGDTELFKPSEVVALKSRGPDPIKIVAAELVVAHFVLQ